MKGVSAIIGAVFVILFTIISISIVLLVGMPAINRAKDSALVGEAYQNMKVVDNLIQEVASEGPGSLRLASIKVTGGTYRITPSAGTFDYETELSSDIFSIGTFKKDGNIQTTVGGGAKASQNSTYLILENDILEIVFYKNGTESSFDSINTSTLIRTIRIKDSGFTLVPNDTGVMIGNYSNSSWGIGYSKLVSESGILAKAEALAHVRSNLTNHEYEVLYTLPASADFFIMSLRNVSDNKTTISFRYQLGTSSSDILKLPNNETTFSPSSSTTTTTSGTQTLNFDNTNYTTNSSSYTVSVLNGTVYYNASDGNWRNITELSQIGQGNWNYTSNTTHTSFNYTLAGSDGYDYGIRDSLAGGSYWINSTGYLYANISLSNDFLTVKMNETYIRIYNYTNGLIYNMSFNTSLIDNNNFIFTYGSGVTNKTVYFFDWKSQSWKVWMRANETLANSTHGMPDWLDPRFKQEFKWRYEFKNTSLTTASLNFTYLMTAHDPFIRVFVDADINKLTLNQSQQNVGISLNGASGSSGLNTRAGFHVNLTNKVITRLSFMLQKFASPTGNIVAKIRDSNDNILGSSVEVDASSISTSYTWYDFNFPGIKVDGSIYLLIENGTSYNAGNDNNIRVGYKETDVVPIAANTYYNGSYHDNTAGYDTTIIIWVSEDHNLTIPISLGETKTFAANKSVGQYFYNSGNDRILFVTQNWRNSTHNFNLTNATNHFNYTYIFNSTLNNYFLFSLGYTGTISTTNFDPNNINISFSSETLESFSKDTQLLTADGWKYFYNLKPTDEVLTLDPSTAKTEWHNPERLTYYNYTGKAYRIVGENGLDLFVSPNHKLYVAINYNSSFDNNSTNSSVENTSISDCSLNAFSSDQIAQPSFNANAKYSESFGWGASSFASCNLSRNSSNGKNFILSFSIPVNASNSEEEKPDFNIISSLLFSSSVSNLDGANNSTLSENKTSSVWLCNSLPLAITPAKNSLASTTSFICIPYSNLFSLSSFNSPSFSLPPNFSASFLVNLLFDANISKTALCKFLDFSNLNSNALATIASKAIFCQSSDSPLIFSSDTLNFISAINTLNTSGYLNISDFTLEFVENVYKIYRESPYTALYFLDSNNNLVKITNIELEDYSDFVYDTTVKNHIILVRRYFGENNFSLPVWSGNSVANSTLTWYDISNVTANSTINWNKTSITNGAQHNVSFDFNYDGGAVSIWHFDEGAGSTAYDSSGSGNTLTSYNNPTWTTCKYGSCLNFTANNHLANVSSTPLGLTGPVTIEAWINRGPVQPVTSQIINWGGSGSSFAFSSNGGNVMDLYLLGLTNNELVSITTISANTWYHVVGTYDGSQMKIYINGKLDSSQLSGGSWNSAYTGVVTIGNRAAADRLFNGTIDELRIYPRALTDWEVKEHYQKEVTKYYDDFNTISGSNSGKYRYFGVEDSNTTLQPITPKDTVLHLRFNDNSTVNATDSSGYGNNGRNVLGVNWTTNSSCKSSFGGCMIFTGAASADILIPQSAGLPISGNQITVAAWVRPGTNSLTNNGIIAQSTNARDDWTMYFSINSRIVWDVYNSGGTEAIATSTTAVTDTNRWYHLAGTYDGSTLRIYVNGTQESTASLTGNLRTDTTPIEIGTYRQGLNTLNGLLDEVLIINRSLSADEIYQLYQGGYNRTVGGHWHRVANADGISSVTYNLTDKNGTFDSQDYDMRILLINGSTSTTTNIGAAPPAACYTPANTSNFYLCSYDNTQYSPSKTASIIYSGPNYKFSQMCYDQFDSINQYFFNMTATGPFRGIIPVTNGVCTDIGNKTYIIQNQEIPSTPFSNYALSGSKLFHLSLIYDRIKITGEGRFTTGTNKVCIQKTGQEAGRVIVNVTAC